HRFPENTGFDERIQQTEFAYLRSSHAAQVAFAENYVGLPY
ncbi:MAG: 4-hydroxybenzoate 3-monooxygenase, partial [Gammaproteobacteria bacterium]|nr:4-hydroxybenzoate 3-monooxygenase [Gammaproteobacteria bacterium]